MYPLTRGNLSPCTRRLCAPLPPCRACIRPEISRTKTFGEKGVSAGQFYRQHLQYIVLNRHPAEFSLLNLTTLTKVSGGRLPPALSFRFHSALSFHFHSALSICSHSISHDLAYLVYIGICCFAFTHFTSPCSSALDILSLSRLAVLLLCICVRRINC